MSDISSRTPRLAAAASPLLSTRLSLNKPLFISPSPAGRKITAGFSYLQRIGKSACIDVWFPQILREELNLLVTEGRKLGPENFPAEWAAVRQFELLQDAGNYKIYDMEATYLTRSLTDNARNMRGGGYRVTVATLGSYVSEHSKDDLEILDRRLQRRISSLIHMLYLDEQSEKINQQNDADLATETWNYQSALPHVGITLGARDLFHPVGDKKTRSVPEQKHQFAQQFFNILDLLPQKHIIHDTAVGLQLPESINEHEWIYLTNGDTSMQAFNSLLKDLFAPFDGISMSTLDGRSDAKSEVKSVAQHMRSYGDRLTPEADQFYRRAQLALH